MSIPSTTAGGPSPSDAGPEQQEHWQPYLHDAVIAVRAPSLVVSGPNGHLGGGASGFYHGDRRALSRLRLDLEGATLVPVAADPDGADGAMFQAVARGVGEHSPDPAVLVTRERRVSPARMIEHLTVANRGRGTVSCRLTVTAGCDLASMATVKSGRAGTDLPPAVHGDRLRWHDAGTTVTLTGGGDPVYGDGTLTYAFDLGPGRSWSTQLRCDVDDPALGVHTPARSPSWDAVQVTAGDSRLGAWVHRSLQDLEALRLVEGSDVFLTAGAPWYLTLFGRDSLWAARMLLPVTTTVAAGTLRVLARRQGRDENAETAEAPGKILHELRRQETGERASTLPPVYFGTVDATALWIILLHDAWRWGMPAGEVADLLPALERALAWMRDHGDADGDGLLEYVDPTGRGLSNQGWKDSSDSVQWRDGTLAEAPIALCEVQAYAYEAAMGGAALLEAFGRPGAGTWRSWATRLQQRFRDTFWVSDPRGSYPAIALDGHKRPVDTVTSNLGHLLGTGLLDADESAQVAARLIAPELAGGFGLRTMSASMPRFNPLGYHTGSVWPHDTAIAVHGLARAGFGGHAARFLPGLLRAAEAFSYRLPELYSGDEDTGTNRPVPYPASCRPQAWSAAAAIHVLQALLGMQADVPEGRLRLDPEVPESLLPLRIDGLGLAGQRLSVVVTRKGRWSVTAAAVTGSTGDAGEQ